VLFVATAKAGDEEMRRRIEEHKKARAKDWNTLEVTTHVGSQIMRKLGKSKVVLIDCVTLLVNNIFEKYKERVSQKEVINEISELIKCIKESNASFIIVTNEVGMGLVPTSKVGRLYRDLLGKANQMLAECADEVYFMVSGLPVKIKPPPCS